MVEKSYCAVLQLGCDGVWYMEMERNGIANNRDYQSDALMKSTKLLHCHLQGVEGGAPKAAAQT